MRRPCALVLGTGEEAISIVAALRTRGIEAWSDTLGRALTDGVSLGWADALVLLDGDGTASIPHLRPIVGFAGPRIVVTCGQPLASVDLAAAFDAGLDYILPPSAPSALIAALVARALRMPVRWTEPPVRRPRRLTA